MDVASFPVVAQNAVVSALVGFLAALVGFRTRIALLENNTKRDKEELTNSVAELRRRLVRTERQNDTQLRILADIAHKLNIETRRFGEDAVMRFINEDEKE